ncbi:MAG: glycosyltransferase family 9 protein [bacterium]|nr:glycosyltransferase family 9 protein [bacterium]
MTDNFNSKLDDPQDRAGLAGRAGLAAGAPNSKLYQLLAQSILQRNWDQGVGLKYLLTSQGREPASILLIQLSSIGDVVYTMPVFLGLREKFKEAKISFLTEEAPAELVRDDPNLDRVIVFEKDKWAKKLADGQVDETIKELHAWVEPLRAGQFDLVINLHTSPRSAFLTKMIADKDVWGLTVTESGRPVVLGHPWMHYKYWITTNPERCRLNPLSSVEIHLLMADVNPSQRRTALSIADCGLQIAECGREEQPIADSGLQIAECGREEQPIADSGLQIAECGREEQPIVDSGLQIAGCGVENSKSAIRNSKWSELGIGRQHPEANYPSLPQKPGFCIGIHPGANYPSRRWKVEYFAGLIDLLAETYGAQVVIFGGKDDQESAALISSHARNSAIHNPQSEIHNPQSPLNLAGKTSLRELAGRLANCRLLISGDTGPAHIAGAVGTPVVVIAGPNWVGPYGPGHLVLQARVPCRGCAKVTCDEHICMELITPEAVASAARILLEKDKAKECLSTPSLKEIDLFYSGDGEPTRFFAYFPLAGRGDNAAGNPQVDTPDLSEVITAILRYCFLNIWQGMKDGTALISEDDILAIVAQRVNLDLIPGQQSSKLSETLSQIGAGFAGIAQLAEEGVGLSRNLYQLLKTSPEHQNEIMAIVSRLDKIDEAICLRDPLSGLGYMAYIDYAAIKEEGDLRTARRSLWCYQHSQRAALRLNQSLGRMAGLFWDRK